jgi:hypothetical protein
VVTAMQVVRVELKEIAGGLTTGVTVLLLLMIGLPLGVRLDPTGWTGAVPMGWTGTEGTDGGLVATVGGAG